MHANAEFLRRQFLTPRGVASGALLGRVSNKLGAQVLRYGKIGGRATWLFPAVLGAYNVYDAPPEQRLRTASGEILGIAFGALGTTIGTIGASLLLSVIIGPGAIAIFACVLIGAVVGYGLSQVGKQGGYLIYDVLSNAMINPPNSLLEIF